MHQNRLNSLNEPPPETHPQCNLLTVQYRTCRRAADDHYTDSVCIRTPDPRCLPPGLMSGSSLGQRLSQADVDTLLWDEIPKAPRAESGDQFADARAKADAKSAEAHTHGALEESAYMVMTKTPTS